MLNLNSNEGAKVMRFRAETMREALEQVKREVGEEALVLDTKRVKVGGFLGVGSRELVELRVSAVGAPATTDAPAEARRDETKRRERSSAAQRSLSLTDDAPALPAHAKKIANESSSPRPASSPSPAKSFARPDSAPPSRAVANAAETRGVEVAETAPRVVHRQQQKTATIPAQSDARAQHATGDIERLRAEIREVKFALGAFAARSSSFASADERSHAGADLAADGEIYDSPFYEAYLELTSAGLAPELARRAMRAQIASGSHGERAPAELARTALARLLPSLVSFADDELSAGNAAQVPVTVFIGPTGVGKTTTIAKLAARIALRERRRVELITLDTYRIAAVEQLRTYAEIIGAGFGVARSVLELDAMTRRFAGEAVVLVDTIGRSPHDLADQLELADYLRASDDVLKCLTLQATTHPADAEIVIKKFALYGANRLVVTKLDETARPGASVGVAAGSRLPLAYLCAGQRVPEDLERATPETLAARVVRAGT